MLEWHRLRTHILMDAGELGSRNMTVIWIEVPPGTSQDLRSHEEAEQVYVCVQGDGTMSAAGDSEQLVAGRPRPDPARDRPRDRQRGRGQRSPASPSSRPPSRSTSCSTSRWRPRSPATKTTSTEARPGTGMGSAADPIRRRVVVHGRVQGVFFRDTVRRRASERGVAGWVRNRPDGAVEAVFEGAGRCGRRAGPVRRTRARAAPRSSASRSPRRSPRGSRGFAVR